MNQSGSQIVVRASTIQGITAGTLSIGTSNLFNSNANNLGFSTVLQPSTIIWSDPGSLPKGTIRFYRPGSAAVTTTEIFIRLSQTCLLKALNIRSLTGTVVSNTDTKMGLIHHFPFHYLVRKLPTLTIQHLYLFKQETVFH